MKLCKPFLAPVALATAGLLLSVPAAAHVAIGDPNPGGIAYHLDFMFHHSGTLTATTGESLPTVGGAGDRQDFNNDQRVDEIGVKSWRDAYDPDFGGPLPNGEYGWALNSRWVMIDLNDLAADGFTGANVTITLQADATGTSGTSDLIPALTVWQGLELQRPVTNADKWFPNGSSTTNWSDWWAQDLKAAALAGNVWWAADDTSNPTHSISLSLPTIALAGTENYLTVVFGGNKFYNPTPFNFANFKATVTVEAVPVPATVWLFGSAFAGLVAVARRRV